MGKCPKFRDHLFRQITWADIDERYVTQLIFFAKEEDMEGAGLNSIPEIPGDPTTRTLDDELTGSAKLVARKEMTLCGLPLIPLTLKAYRGNVRFEAVHKDGDSVAAGTTIGTLNGLVCELLPAERVLLNFLQHLSGVATQTKRYVDALGDSSTRILDTRKTTPAFRVLEKYAVACGGGWNHRIGLFDRVMLKDNHLAAAGETAGERLADAVKRARAKNPNLAIEVEVDSLSQVTPVLDAFADVVLLDNFSVTELKAAVKHIGDCAYTEASGGITIEALPELGTLGLDFISSGALVHKAEWVDIGLDWE